MSPKLSLRGGQKGIVTIDNYQKRGKILVTGCYLYTRVDDTNPLFYGVLSPSDFSCMPFEFIGLCLVMAGSLADEILHDMASRVIKGGKISSSYSLGVLSVVCKEWRALKGITSPFSRERDLWLLTLCSSVIL